MRSGAVCRAATFVLNASTGTAGSRGPDETPRVPAEASKEQAVSGDSI
jgi:hypothetical protein